MARRGVLVEPPTPAPGIRFVDPAAREQVHRLQHPIWVGYERRDAITIRRLTGRELYDLVLAGGDEDALVRRVHARMCDLPEGAIDELDADDASEVLAAIRPFSPAAIRSLDPVDEAAPIAPAAPTAGAGF